MITLNEIAYNIRNLAYGGKNSTENNISLEQIKHWVHYHRAKLIADNVDKGITHNNFVYQSIPLTTYNSGIRKVRDYIGAIIDHLRNTAIPAPAIADYFVHTRTYPNGAPLAEWAAISQNLNHHGLMGSMTPNASGNQHWVDQYGRETASTHQRKGDFRNFGYHNFQVPTPIQLKDNKGIRELDLSRAVLFANGSDDGYFNHFSKAIKVYNKKYGDFDEYNKFTNNSKPYYTEETSRHTKLGDNGLRTGPYTVHSSNNHIISIHQLQVSPNYLDNKTTGAARTMFWNYKAKVDMILQNPTDIHNIYNNGVYEFLGTNSSNTINASEAIETSMWDDAVNPYPIPMEYVSDLIQRVIQVELQTELKTQGDEIADGLDDNLRMKRSGAQVQR